MAIDVSSWTSRPLGAAVLVCGCTAAPAADWSVGGRLAQDVTLRSEGGGDSASSLQGVSSVGLTIAARTQTTTWRLNPGFRVFERAGSDSDEPLDVNASISGGVSRTGPRLTIDANASFVPEFVGDSDFSRFLEPDPDTGELEPTLSQRDVEVLQITARASVGASYALDSRNSLRASAFVRIRDYVDATPELTASQSFGGSLSLNHAFTPRSSGSLTASVTEFSRDGESGDTTSVTLSSGFSTALTPRHRAQSSLSVTSSASGEDDDVTIGGGASLSYDADDTSFTIGFNQGIEQNAAGDVVAALSLRAGISHRIDSASRLGLSAGMSIENPVFGAGDDDPSFVVTPRYEVTLAEDWRLSAGYGLRLQTLDDADHRVFMTLARSFSLLD